MRFTIAVVLVVALSPLRVEACASCGCGDATLTATGVERPYKNRIRLAFEERYGSMTFGDEVTGEHVQFLRSSLAASWSPMRRLTFAAMLPWMTSWIRRASMPQTSVTGLGDLELLARGVVYQEQSFAPHHVLWLSGGLKLPTGYRAVDSSGYPVSDDDQPGSGSWDPFGGVSYAWFSGDLLSFFASSSVRWTTSGWHGYRRGATVGGSLAVQLQPWRWGAFQLGGDLLWQRADALGNGHLVPNTGGTTGYLAVGLLANPWRDLLIRLAADAPFLTAMNGTQKVGPQFVAQVSYDFN